MPKIVKATVHLFYEVPSCWSDKRIERAVEEDTGRLYDGDSTTGVEAYSVEVDHVQVTSKRQATR